MGLVDSAILLSHPRFYQKNLYFVINILLDSYPLFLIVRIIRPRLKIIFNRLSMSNNVINKDVDKKIFFNISYVASISERFKHVVGNTNVMLSYSDLYNLKSFIKDVLLKQHHRNVYKISCLNCDATYIGQVLKNENK